NLYRLIINKIVEKTQVNLHPSFQPMQHVNTKIDIIPPARIRYLSEIVENNRAYEQKVESQDEIAQKLFGIHKTIQALEDDDFLQAENIITELQLLFKKLSEEIEPANLKLLQNWEAKKQSYKDEFYLFKVRNKELKIQTHTT